MAPFYWTNMNKVWLKQQASVGDHISFDPVSYCQAQIQICHSSVVRKFEWFHVLDKWTTEYIDRPIVFL